MAKKRKIPKKIKLQLREEVGGKCANPGCSNWRSHIHHIKHWAVFKAHDSEHMIAICPSCHDEVHHGRLKISDDVLYAWKKIGRTKSTSKRAHIYVEPASEIKILAGSVSIQTRGEQLALFELSNQNSFSFRVLEENILLLTGRIATLDGQEVLRIVDNHVKLKKDDSIDFRARAGKVRLTVPAKPPYVLPWIIQQMRLHVPDYAADDRVVAIDIEVVRPGVVRVQGLWNAPEGVVVITENTLSFPGLYRRAPISIVGEGEGTVIVYDGPIASALFGFGKRS